MTSDVINGLHQSFESQNMGVSAYLKALTSAVDEQLIRLWETSGLAELDTHLIALGGYGRHQLFPYSDVDTLVLIPTLNTEIEEALARFNQIAWDAGLRLHLSHEFTKEPRTVADVELSTQTSWLEARLIVGDPLDYIHWRNKAIAPLNTDEFIQAKIFEQQQRHIKYEEAEACLEPNIKEHPGGLRDLHTLFWVDRARFGRRTFQTLLAHYDFSSYEIRRIQRAHTLFCTLRAHLHLITKRQEDILRYDLHLEIAKRLGIHREASHLHASERLMQHYYRMSHLIQQANRFIIGHIQHPVAPSPTPDSPMFFIDNHQLCIRDTTSFIEDPVLLFSIFAVWQNTPEAQDIHPTTQRGLWEHRHQLDTPPYELRQRLQDAFISIIKGPTRIHRSLQYLHQLELLERYLPDWQRIRGQIQHDYMHRYPLDEHNLRLIRYLRRMADPLFAHELPEAHALITHFERPEVLWTAGLFHDIGKGLEGDDPQLGADKARSFAEEHQFTHEDIDLIEWLAREHLILSRIAQTQDINDYHVVNDFVTHVPSERALVALYLLTIADIRATNPSLWNPWRSHLLDTLFQRARTGLQNLNTYTPTLEAIQKEVLAQASVSHPPLFWKSLEPYYFYHHSIDELTWHIHILQDDLDKPHIQARRYKGTWQFFIYWPDQPGILSQLCAFYSARRLSIVEAKIVTSQTQWTFNSYSVLEPNYECDPRELEILCSDLKALLSHPDISPLTQNDIPSPRLSRRQKALPLHPEIHITPDIHHSDRFNLLIIAADRENLWADVTQCIRLSSINVHDARIQTLGERVEGTLNISGSRLNVTDEQAVLEAKLFHLLYPI